MTRPSPVDMPRLRLLHPTFSCFIILNLLCACQSQEIRSWLKDKPLTQSEITRGLKEALRVGSTRAATDLSRSGAYLNNPKLKIPFPPRAQGVATVLTRMGAGKLVNDVIESINRAAEHGAKTAAPIFVDAIHQMSIQDGVKILYGRQDEATRFLRQHTFSKLQSRFRLPIRRALDEVDATQYWSEAIMQYNRIPLIEKVNPNLEDWVTSKALEGLFQVLAQEEAKIRKDPVARITPLLQRVFATQRPK